MTDFGSIKAVYLDAVGTVLHPARSIAETYAEIGSRHGFSVDTADLRRRLRDAYARQEEIDRTADWTTDEQRERDRWLTIVTECIGAACFEDLWNYYSQPGAWRIDPGTEPILEEARRRSWRIGMASNFDGRLESLVRSFAELSPLHDSCIISSRVGHRKPGGRFFAAVTAQGLCRPEEIVFIGDDPRNDYEGALSAGMQPLLISADRPVDRFTVRSLAEAADRLRSNG